MSIILLYTLSGLLSSVNSWMIAGGIIMGSVGLLRVYMKWQSGNGRDIDQEIYVWIGGAFFLASVGVAVRIMYGV